MVRIRPTVGLGFALFLALSACSKANFRGSTSAGSTNDATAKNNKGSTNNVNDRTDIGETGNPNGSGPGGSNNPGSNGANSPGGGGPNDQVLPPRINPGADRPPTECIKGDKAELGWSGKEKDCMDSGKIFNFDRGVCQGMPQAKFNCDWQTLMGTMEKLQNGSVRSLVTPLLKQSSSDGSKLVACGQSQDGMRIAVQWIVVTNLPAAECNNTPRNSVLVTTGCYTRYQAGVPIPDEPKTDDEKRQRTFDCLGKI